METGLLMEDLWQWQAKDILPVFKSDGTACLAGYFFFKKSVHVGIHVWSGINGLTWFYLYFSLDNLAES